MEVDRTYISIYSSVGLTLALYFKKFKIPFVLLEKSDHLSNHPSAHYINMRTREVIFILNQNFEELNSVNSQIDEIAENLENFQTYTYVRRIGEKALA